MQQLAKRESMCLANFEREKWKIQFNPAPQQENMCDCGPISLVCALNFVREKKVCDFTPQHIPFYRRKILNMFCDDSTGFFITY